MDKNNLAKSSRTPIIEYMGREIVGIYTWLDADINVYRSTRKAVKKDKD